MADDPIPKCIEPAGAYGYVVEQERVDHDPHYGPKREHRTVEDGIDGQTERHLPTDYRDNQARDEPRQSRLPCRPAQYTQKHQHCDDRQDGDDERKPEAVSYGCQKLLEHQGTPAYGIGHSFLPSYIWITLITNKSSGI